MKLYKPTTLTIFQLFAAWVLVAVITCPGDAIHHGPMLILKGHGGGNGAMAAAGLVAAGLAIKLLTDMGKGGHHGHHGHHEHHGGGGGGGGGFGGGGLAMMQSLAGHDGGLGQYGYTPEIHGGWMRR